MKKVFVTGVSGQLGYDVVHELFKRNIACVGSDIFSKYRGEVSEVISQMVYVPLDLTDESAVQKTLHELTPDVVIHCAAWTAVDLAEEESNREKVFNINERGTQNLARACRALNAKMLYLSTDYVFDGKGEAPWEPDYEKFSPLNVYGSSKLAGEFAVKTSLEKYFIVRIAWVFGKNGKNFIKTMLSLGKTHESLRIVNDQIGTPTYTFDLARLLVDMIETEKYGVYHATNEGGFISWAEFAEEIFKQSGLSTKVIRVTTEEYGESKAKRPFNSRLDKRKLLQKGFIPLPPWKDALARYLKEIQN